MLCALSLITLGKIFDRNPDLVAMGVDSCSEGRVFKSQHHILYGHYSHSLAAILYCMFKKTKINEKEALNCPF